VAPPADPVTKSGALEPEETPEQARRRKRQLLVDFLGFGEGR